VQEVLLSLAEAPARDGCPPGTSLRARSAESWPVGGPGRARAMGEVRFRWCVYCVAEAAGVWLMLDHVVAAGCFAPLCAMPLWQV
jgi:hypothetical protein